MTSKYIEVLTAAEEPKGKGKMLVVNYKDLGTGKLDSKKLVQMFVDKTVYQTLQNGAGNTYEIEQVKEGDFWQWKTINIADPASVPAAPTAPAFSGTGGGYRKPATNVENRYETPEERAKRQISIIRQSSLAQAVAFNPGADTEEVLKIAEIFENWVTR